MKPSKPFLIALLLLSFVASFFLFTEKTVEFAGNIERVFATSFFTQGKSGADLRKQFLGSKKYNTEPVKILIVPGHDRDSWGTQFGSLREIDLNLELSLHLKNFLENHENFEVILAQNEEGFLPELNTFFEEKSEEIDAFRKKHRGIMENLIRFGLIRKRVEIVHNNASSIAAHRLYGINKWANDNKVDIVIHVHFNDEPSRRYNKMGKYTGLAIYIPEDQYSNASVSQSLVSFVLRNLNTRAAVSDHPREGGGIVKDQELIAIGANNTLDAASLLIEYSYIYEPQFRTPALRSLLLKELAFKTSQGIAGFFGTTAPTSASAETTLLPHRWTRNLSYGLRTNTDVLRLQTALIYEGLYPPKNRDKNDCPITGSYLGCTRKAVQAFQARYGIEPTGYVGEITRGKLNALYSENK